jgi:hypothetical protein
MECHGVICSGVNVGGVPLRRNSSCSRRVKPARKGRSGSVSWVSAFLDQICVHQCLYITSSTTTTTLWMPISISRLLLYLLPLPTIYYRFLHLFATLSLASPLHPLHSLHFLLSLSFAYAPSLTCWRSDLFISACSTPSATNFVVTSATSREQPARFVNFKALF